MPFPLSVFLSNQGSFPPPALPGIPGTTSPSATLPARPAPRGVPVWCVRTTGRASRVATVPFFHACRRHYPGGTVRCSRRSLPGRWQPSPKNRRVGFRIIRFEACSAFIRVAARMVARSPMATCSIGVLQAMSLPPSPAPIASGWSDSCRAGFAPAGERRLSTAHCFQRIASPCAGQSGDRRTCTGDGQEAPGDALGTTGIRKTAHRAGEYTRSAFLLSAIVVVRGAGAHSRVLKGRCWRGLQRAASGVRKHAPSGASRARIRTTNDRGNDAREPGRVEPSRRFERRDVATRTGTVVRGEVIEAPAATPARGSARGSAPARVREHRAVRRPVHGEAVTGGARSADAASRGDADGRRSRPGRARRGR